jgi:hypothetical protein
MPLTTFAMLPVTCRIVTAVCTLELTASILDANRSRLRFSFFFRMAFCAYILAMSEWFCWIACGGIIISRYLEDSIKEQYVSAAHLLQLGLLRLLIFARFGCLSVELLRCELSGIISNVETDRRGRLYFEIEEGLL